MKIDEKIEEMQSKLIQTVTVNNLKSEEDVIRLLQEIGLDKDSATKLLLAYRTAESARETAENIFNAALICAYLAAIYCVLRGLPVILESKRFLK